MRQSEVEGLKLLCKYSGIPNKLGYCGKENSFLIFESFLRNPNQNKAAKIKKIASSFVGLWPYLKLISEANGLSEFDEDVIRAYWIGNKLLGNIGMQDIREMILKDFTKPGLLPFEIAEEKALKINSKVFPSHSFHVLYINFVTKKVKPILANLDSCLIKPAEKKGDYFDTWRLSLNNGRLEMKKSKIVFDSYEKGPIFSTHWQSIVEEITKAEEKNLKKYTTKNIELANSKLIFSMH